LDVAKKDDELASMSKEDTKHFKVVIEKVKDTEDRLIYVKIKKPAYQFREFFVQEIFEEKNLDPEIKYVDKLNALSTSKVNSSENINNYIINSPLM